MYFNYKIRSYKVFYRLSMNRKELDKLGENAKKYYTNNFDRTIFFDHIEQMLNIFVKTNQCNT